MTVLVVGDAVLAAVSLVARFDKTLQGRRRRISQISWDITRKECVEKTGALVE